MTDTHDLATARARAATRKQPDEEKAEAHRAGNGHDAEEPDVIVGGWTRRALQRKHAQDIGDGIDGTAPIAEAMPLGDMLKHLVFIADGSRVALRDNPHITLPLAEFRVVSASSRTFTKVGGLRAHRTVDLWLQHKKRITTHTLTFRPGHGEFTTDPEGAPALNLWRACERVASTASVEPFLQHVEYLVPDAAERGRFLDWLAHIEQNPGVLPHTHYLMVAQQTGIGRNWLASLLARVWAGATRLGFDLVGAMHSGFNGPISRRLLVIVDELKAADTGYGAVNHAQQLKAMLTTEHRTINPKFGRMHIEFNCARWLMFSQWYDALPLERSDRRVIVITNPTERKASDYYEALYARLDDASFVAAVVQWLAARDISGFNPHTPAPMNTAKTKAIEACVGDIERALIDLRDGCDAPLMTASAITEWLTDCGLARPHSRVMAAAYAAAGLVVCELPAVINGKRHRVVALRDADRYRYALGPDLARVLTEWRSS